MRNTAGVTGGKPIAVWSQSISGVSAINPLVTFYDIHGRTREVLFIYFIPDTTRDEKFYMFRYWPTTSTLKCVKQLIYYLGSGDKINLLYSFNRLDY
jgi:hypothetical protein